MLLLERLVLHEEGVVTPRHNIAATTKTTTTMTDQMRGVRQDRHTDRGLVQSGQGGGAGWGRSLPQETPGHSGNR